MKFFVNNNIILYNRLLSVRREICNKLIKIIFLYNCNWNESILHVYITKYHNLDSKSDVKELTSCQRYFYKFDKILKQKFRIFFNINNATVAVAGCNFVTVDG